MPGRQKGITLGVMITVVLVATRLLSPSSTVIEASALPNVPYDLGNWTYVGKPVFPMKINASQIPIGDEWTFVYTLSSSSTYHIYFYGSWIGSKTDYDVHVYNPQGELESIHTEAAGLLEHLGTTVEDPLFAPQHSGEYSFLIVNDARESQGADAATFMIAENIDCNRWHSHHLEGKVNYVNVYYTTWAYEFAASSERVEVWVDVPETLDMYEARLYIMANPSKGKGSLLNGYPLAWEPGLYGATDMNLYGGYNLIDEGFKHSDAMASCEHFGQDMLVNYSSRTGRDLVLYHLVLIAENGAGAVRFRVKTDFEAPSLSVQAPEVVQAGSETSIIANVSDTNLSSVMLNYTNNDWRTWTCTEMRHLHDIMYAGTIPRQKAGEKVSFKIEAEDIVGNIGVVEGNCIAKENVTVTLSLSDTDIYANENITVSGQISQDRASVELQYASQDMTVSRHVTADNNGFFTDSFSPDKIGDWTVTASCEEDEAHFGAFGDPKEFSVLKIPTSIDLKVSEEAVNIGDELTVVGEVNPRLDNAGVELQFSMPNGSVFRDYTRTKSDGVFSLNLILEAPGTWEVKAKLLSDTFFLPSQSDAKSFVVNDTLMNSIFSLVNQYSLYIIGAAVAAGSAVGILFYRRRREEY